MTLPAHINGTRSEFNDLRSRLLRWSVVSLVTATWLSGGIFGAYILSFFAGTALQGASERWNESLPMLRDTAKPFASSAIGVHFLAGGILLLLGPIQLIGGVRRAVPSLHRWLGRLYVLTAGLAGLGGLAFILTQGTLGGRVMDVGFGIYGVLMVLGSIMTYSHARARRYALHRAWAIRLFALTVGSWLFRVDYGFWFMAMGRVGHTSQFTGWFDTVMVFFFYVPNLIVAELAIRAGDRARAPLFSALATVTLFVATIFVLTATWSFTADYWGPGIVSGFTGAPL